MGIVKKIAIGAGKKVSEEIAKKAVKKILGSKQKNSLQKINNDSADEDFFSSATNFLKQAKKEFSSSDVVDIVGMATGTSAVMGATMFAGRTILDAKNTIDILSKEFDQLRDAGKITRDILDAVLCENKSKLLKACDEVIEAEKIGKPLKYLTEDEIKSALSIRKTITKTIVHKILG